MGRWAVGEASLEEIEEHNILVASQIAMARALKGLGDVAGVILVDGLPAKHLGKEHVAVVGGRNLSIDCCGFCGCKSFTRPNPFTIWSVISHVWFFEELWIRHGGASSGSPCSRTLSAPSAIVFTHGINNHVPHGK